MSRAHPSSDTLGSEHAIAILAQMSRPLMLPPQQRRQSSLPLENVASARLMDLVRDRMPREYHDTAVPVEGRSRGWDDEDARRDGKRTKTMDPKEEEDEDEETEHEQVEEDQGDEYMETPPPAPRSKRIPKPRALTPTPGPTPTRKLTKIKPPLKPRVSKAKGKGVATGSKGKVFIGELGSKEEEREQEGAAAGPSTAEGAEFVPEGEEADAGLGEVVEDWSRARKDNHKEVERRRRETINSGINQLKKLVPNCDKAKGSILSSAATYISTLKAAEASNIEKWTLEKLLADQALGEARAEAREWKFLLERVEGENERLRGRVEDLLRQLGPEKGGTEWESLAEISPL